MVDYQLKKLRKMNSLITANILSNQVLAFMSNYQKNKMAITEESKTVIVNQINAVDNQMPLSYGQCLCQLFHIVF